VSRIHRLEPEFVEEIPRTLEPGKLYISIPYTTALHLCCCGCGIEVVTPLHPTRWSLSYDGETISLSPSVGNWNLACQSHYVVRKGAVRWAPRWSKGRIEAGRERDRAAVESYFDAGAAPDAEEVAAAPAGKRGWLYRILARPRR
jgi:hypothetical protein